MALAPVIAPLAPIAPPPRESTTARHEADTRRAVDRLLELRAMYRVLSWTPDGELVSPVPDEWEATLNSWLGQALYSQSWNATRRQAAAGPLTEEFPPCPR